MPPLLVVLDFDGTITQEDSLDALTRFAAHYNAAKEPAVVSESSLLDDWNISVIEPYLRDLAKFENEYTPTKQDRTTWEEEKTYLESLRTVEESSVERVEASPIFKGFGDDDYRRFGREAAAITADEGAEKSGQPTPTVRLRPGFNDFLLWWAAASQRSQQQQQRKLLGLVSVNWSRHFIEGVLGVADSEHVQRSHHTRRRDRTKAAAANKMNIDEIGQSAAEKDNATPPPVISKLVVDRVVELTLVANHITPEPRINGPPGWQKPLTTADDKQKAFEQLRGSLKHSSGLVVYMGDSKTDLLCLRDADLGLILADGPDQSSLFATLRRLGYQVPHVHQDIRPVTKYAWARDFTEILESKILSKLCG
ncbi:hypothetical protein QBC37DRAFT_483420 [Rhypophila decipiens]|uniref:Uncharacterized protein n=1 Tax=Rhypophila decipiens TaxID=261697 RepID=A0AAN6YBG3_9PEZI|nr:hypothetical protein QBC37DRAFT_483420 [Rhypophila decipiens]